MITRFNEVGMTGRKRFLCACGRRLTRQKRFYQTLNPYNKNAQGLAKTQGEILTEVSKELKAWQSTPDRCTHETMSDVLRRNG